MRRVREAYGPHERHVGDWWLPDRDGGRLPTVVLVHGGFWRPRWDLSLEDDVAADLAARGFLVGNVDYRPSSEPWPATLVDAAAAHDHVRTHERVDLARSAVVGHSAGGHLALWLLTRDLPVRLDTVVSMAGVVDLARAADLGLGDDAVAAFLDGADPGPADPLTLFDRAPAARVVLVHGDADDTVPVELSRRFAAAHPWAELVELPGVSHYAFLDPAESAWSVVRDLLVQTDRR